MPDFIKMAETIERKRLNPAIWDERINKAKTARYKWDEAADECRKIRDNELPARGQVTGAEGFTGKFYVDNWLVKAKDFRVSKMASYDVFLDLKSEDNNPYDPNRQLLEMTINFTADKFRYHELILPVLDDWQVFGFGVSYQQWDAEKITNFWKTGSPEFRRVDPRDFWVDEGADQTWDTARWFMSLNVMDVDMAKMLFPDKADQISVTNTEMESRQRYTGNGDTNQIDIMLIQYKELYLVEKIEVFDTVAQESKFFLKGELDEYLTNGGEIPDTIEIRDTFKVKEYVWFQFYYCPQLSLVLDEPTYVGTLPSFQYVLGCTNDNDPYPRSIIWYLKDLQEISVILMTLLVIQSIKLNKATPYIEEGALENEDDFMEDRDSLDFVGRISKEWREQVGQGISPITWERPEFRADIPIQLQSMIMESIKTTTGAIDSARGEASYSGQSGVQTAQLQQASSLLTKLDDIKLHNLWRSIGEKLKYDISRFKTHEFKLFGINEQGQEDMITVNSNNIPQFDPEKYYCEPAIETMPEVMQQMERDRAIQLNANGKMSTTDMLAELGYTNPEQIWSKALEEQGNLQMIQMIKQNPALGEAFNMLVQSPELVNKLLGVKPEKSLDNTNKA